MKLYSIIHPLYMSFYSKDLYRDVARNWKGLCLTYLLSLIALSSISEVMRIDSSFSDFLNNDAPKFIKQLPAITITEGNVSIDKPEPYFIKDEETGNPIVIIDTAGEITSLEKNKAMVLLTRKTLVFRKNAKESVLNLSDIDNYFIDKTVAYKLIDEIDRSFAFILYPLVIFFSFLLNTAVALLFAAIGRILSRSANAALDYRSLVRLAVIALTPFMITEALLTLMGIVIAGFSLIGPFVSVGYLYFGIRANSEKRT